MKHKASFDTYPRIWRTVARIPRGKVASYGTIARLSGFPTQPRIAGYALHRLPDGLDIPWQRVVNSRGQISLPGERGREQKRLLEKEGILFVRNAIDMRRFGWKAWVRGTHKAPARTSRRGSSLNSGARLT